MPLIGRKAAMFGLDARIALAIFGALSVITGAALYGAIQDSKSTSLLREMQEINNALEAHYLDTGSPLNIEELDLVVHTKHLITNELGLKGWKGPYLSYSPVGDDLIHPLYTKVYLRVVSDIEWTHPNNDLSAGLCKNQSASKCFYWVLVTGVPNNIRLGIEKKIDGDITVDSDKSGNVRYGSSNTEIYLKSMPYKGNI